MLQGPEWVAADHLCRGFPRSRPETRMHAQAGSLFGGPVGKTGNNECAILGATEDPGRPCGTRFTHPDAEKGPGIEPPLTQSVGFLGPG